MITVCILGNRVLVHDLNQHIHVWLSIWYLYHNISGNESNQLMAVKIDALSFASDLSF